MLNIFKRKQTPLSGVGEGTGGTKSGKLTDLDQFFTPDEIVKVMYDIAYKYGFKKTGKILETSAGNGRFLKYSPNLSNTTAFEIDTDAFLEMEKNYYQANLYNLHFERAFLDQKRGTTRLPKNQLTWLSDYPFDLVIGNPPYGSHKTKYISYFPKEKYIQIEHFFILKSVQMLKKGGLAVLLIPSSFMRNGIAYNEYKKKIFALCDLVDVVRLPNNTFKNTSIGTDIIVLKRK